MNPNIATSAVFEHSNRNTLEFETGLVVDYFSVTYRLTTPVPIDGIDYICVDVSRGINQIGGDFEMVSLFAAREVRENNPITYAIEHPESADMVPWTDAPAWVRDIKERAYDRMGVFNQV